MTTSGVDDPEVDAVMGAARIMVALSARAIAALDEAVTLPQLRVLVMVASRGTLNLAAVAAGLGVHASNATRAVDRLVVAGLLARGDDPTDRRNLLLELTPAGRSLVDGVMEHRRAAVVEILERMPARARRGLAEVLDAFAAAADAVPEDAIWSLGWTTSSTGRGR